MFEFFEQLTQDAAFGTVVGGADGTKEYIVVYVLRTTAKQSLYFAVESDTKLPAVLHLVAVEGQPHLQPDAKKLRDQKSE